MPVSITGPELTGMSVAHAEPEVTRIFTTRQLNAKWESAFGLINIPPRRLSSRWHCVDSFRAPAGGPRHERPPEGGTGLLSHEVVAPTWADATSLAQSGWECSGFVMYMHTRSSAYMQCTCLA